MRNGEESRIWKGALAGLAGGLAASWAMNEFQAGLGKAASAVSSDERPNGGSAAGATGSSEPHDEEGSEDATMKTAAAISARVLGRGLSKDEKQKAGPIVHYAFGGAMGAVYGALAEVMPATRAARGLSFGTALWFGADEVMVPAVGLSRSPLQYPVSTHGSALAAHLVYGFTVDLVRRMIRSVL